MTDTPAAREIASAATLQFVELMLETGIDPLIVADALMTHAAAVLSMCGHDEAAIDIVERIAFIEGAAQRG
jgi:tryptophan synthase alpha subunit